MVLQFPNGTVVNDAENVVRRYFRDMFLGRRYEERAYSQENTSRPNHLLLKNWRASFWIHARGMSWKTMRELFNDEQECSLPLPAIPVEAVLASDWSSTQRFVARALEMLMAKPGVAAANATKILYQKRPALIPILDSVVCAKLAGRWDLRRSADVLRAIDGFRDAMMRPQNFAELCTLKDWIADAADVSLSQSARNSISVMRLYDIIAWSAGR